jgi:uncharacterized protein
MQRLMLWSYRNPLAVILLFTLFSVLAASQLSQISIDASSSRLMVYKDPAKDFYEQTLEEFGSDKILVIFARDEDLFSPEKLEILDDLVFAFEELPGVDRVESLYSVTHFKGQDGFLENFPLMDYTPYTLEEALEVRDNALSNHILLDNLISRDGMATAINLYLDPDPSDPNFNVEISEKVQLVLDEFQGEFLKLFQIGGAYTWKQITVTIMQDLFKIVPLSMLCLLVMIMVVMRSATAAYLPMLTAGLSVLWTLGFMVVAGIPLTMLTFIFPSLIIVIGSTEDTHILAEYMEGVYDGKGDRPFAVHFMAGKVGTAVLLTAVTTILGFAAIMVNEVIIVREFGIVTTFALFANAVATTMGIPVFLRYFGPRKMPKGFGEEGVDIFKRMAGAITRLLRSNARMVFSIMFALALGMAFMGTKVVVDNDILSFFKSTSDIRNRVGIMHDDLSGAYTLNLRIISGQPDSFREPEYLEQVARFQDELEKTGLMDKSTSFADYIRMLNQEMNDGDPSYFTIPPSRDLISQYLLLLSRDDIDRYVSGDFSEVCIAIRHNINSSTALLEAVDHLETLVEETINPYFVAQFTGENLLTNTAANSIASGQVKSLSLLALIMFLLMSLQFVSFKAGLLSLIPTLFPVTIFYGLMVLFNIPLNTGTCLVAAIAIGIAVDDTIHLMSRYYKEMRVLQNPQEAMGAMLGSQARPVMSTSLALMLGFGILMFSDFVPIMQFGLLAALVIVFALLSDLFLTPVICTRTYSTTIWEMLDLKLDPKVLYESKLFQQMRKWEVKRVVLLGKLLKTKTGDLALRKGDHGESMFLLLSGRATVFDSGHRGEIVFASLEPGDVFGEMALVSPGPRSANIRADEDMEYIEITWTSLARIQRFLPYLAGKLYLNLSRILGDRLSAMNKEVCQQ